jgi:hypothetical protein
MAIMKDVFTFRLDETPTPGTYRRHLIGDKEKYGIPVGLSAGNVIPLQRWE